jgi:hypothetical protein
MYDYHICISSFVILISAIVNRGGKKETILEYIYTLTLSHTHCPFLFSSFLAPKKCLLQLDYSCYHVCFDLIRLLCELPATHPQGTWNRALI